MRRKPKDPNSPRAQAARANGAKSKGPVTDEGKKNSSQNALKHGLTALKWFGRPEDEAAYQEFSQAVTAELNPQGILQEVLAERIVSAMWRLRRIPAIEASLALSVEESDKWTYNQRVAQWPHQKLALSRYEANIHRCMHKDMQELRALKEEAAQAARQAIFDEREREVREARRLQWLEAQNAQLETLQNEPNQVQELQKREWDDLYNTPRPDPNTEHLTPNTHKSPNEPNQIQESPKHEWDQIHNTRRPDPNTEHLKPNT
jgi:hypothetical protein